MEQPRPVINVPPRFNIDTGEKAGSADKSYTIASLAPRSTPTSNPIAVTWLARAEYASIALDQVIWCWFRAERPGVACRVVNRREYRCALVCFRVGSHEHREANPDEDGRHEYSSCEKHPFHNSPP